MEDRFQDGLQVALDDFLGDSIRDRRNPQRSGFRLAVALRDVDPSNRWGQVAPRGHSVPELVRLSERFPSKSAIDCPSTPAAPWLAFTFLKASQTSRLGMSNGFTSSTGSSCCQLASVGRWSRLNNAAPSVQLHYRAFIPNTSCSVPVRRIGTLILAVLAACDFSLCIGAQVLTFRTKAWLSFAPPPCRMPLGPSQASPKLIPKEWPPPGFGIA